MISVESVGCFSERAGCQKLYVECARCRKHKRRVCGGVKNCNVECAGVSKTLTLSVRGCQKQRVCGGVENVNVECGGCRKL